MNQVRILLVEDNQADVRLFREALAGTAGAAFAITLADCLSRAIQLLASHPFDVVLLDLTLPDSEGFETLTRVHAQAPDMPVVVLTGYDDEAFATQAVQEGAQDYLVKGKVDGGLLIRAVRYAIERTRTLQQLRESEERYRSLAESVPDMVYIVDGQGSCVYANAAAAALMRGKPSRLEGLSQADIFPVNTARHHVQAIQRVLKTGENWSVEERLPFRSGEMWSETRLIPLRDKSGKPQAVMGMTRDITDRKITMDALRTTTSQLRNLFDNLDQMFLSVDVKNMHVLQVSPACEKIYGLPRQAFFDDPYVATRLVYEEDQPVVEEAMKELCAGKTVNREYRIVRPNGSIRWVEANCKPTVDVRGKLQRLDAVMSDITARKDAEAVRLVLFQILEATGVSDNLEDLLEITRRLLGTLLDTTNFFVALFDPEKNLYSFPIFNDEFDNFGASHHPLPDSMTDYVRRTGQPLLANEKMMQELQEAGEVKLIGTPSRIWLGVPLKTSHGVIGVMVLQSYTNSALYSGHDFELMKMLSGHLAMVIERKRAIDALFESESQLRQAQKMEAIGRLAGGVAHDFNNLLTTILGQCELALFKLHTEDPLCEGLEQIMRAAERAASLTRQLLAFSRKQVLQPRVLDLNAAVTDTEKMLRRLIGEDVDLTTHLALPLGAVRADPGQIEQVLMNLAVNARDAMPKGGRLVIETSNVDLDGPHAWMHKDMSPGRYVRLSVADNGCGMDAETLSHIFEPFFTTKDVGKGTGLGLSTVYGIVKQSGGHIWVSSEEGHGSSFEIFLPRIEAAVEKIKPPPTSLSGHGTETILLVEDDDAVRDLVRFILVGRGYRVLEARNAADALVLAEKSREQLDLLITDVIMPKTNGDLLAMQINDLRPDLKVLFMSGYMDDALANCGLLASGRTLLAKPFTADTLLRKVRELLDTRLAS